MGSVNQVKIVTNQLLVGRVTERHVNGLVDKKQEKKKYCGKREVVINSCPVTCDTCVSNAPTDGFVCEDSAFEFSVNDAGNPTLVKYTCDSLDDQYNTDAVTDFCSTSPEIKAMCPVLCDNCMSNSPSSKSSAPSTNPTVSPTTCVDLKESGKQFNFDRYTSDGLSIEKTKTGKKCKHLADKNEIIVVRGITLWFNDRDNWSSTVITTIISSYFAIVSNGKTNVGLFVADY